jgi:hypothetical protein
MKNLLLEIWKDKLSDYVILDYTYKIWISGLLALFAIGFVTLLYGLISGEADVQNATFGIFDTLG